jgi:hypothetical protein
MSEATKHMALVQAIALFSKVGALPGVILDTAAQFDAFLTGTAQPKAAKVVAPATKPAKPAKPPVVEEDDEDDADADEEVEAEDEPEDDEEGITKEQVGEAIAALIDNDQKDDAIAILTKFKAKSLSSLKPESYEAAMKLAKKKLNIE